MFLKIILLGLVFLVDNTVGNCSKCQINHVVCHSKDTFSLCVEGKPTSSVVRCPKDKVCTADSAICVGIDNVKTMPSCLTGQMPVEIGSFYEVQDDVRSDSLTSILDSIDSSLSAGETGYPSSTETQDDNISPSTEYSDTTVDTTVTDVSETAISTTAEDVSSTATQEDEVSSTKENTYTSTDTTSNDEQISSTTDYLSTTETTEYPELTSSSTEDISSSDISSTSTSAPRDATTFCSENKEIGTFRAEGDTTCKWYYVCTTYKGGFKGYEFNCGEKNYFNAEISMCQSAKPDDC